MSKWIRNSQENNGILVVTTLPSGDWLESVVSSPQYGELADRNAYLVIFSDDGRTGGAVNASRSLGKVGGGVLISPCANSSPRGLVRETLKAK